MTRKESVKASLLFAFFALALGGWLLHVRIHSPLIDEENWIPFVSGIISVFGLTWLFWRRSTIAYAYVINGILVIVGTITMTHFSLVNFKGPLSLESLFLQTLLPDIAIAWGKFAIGKAIFDLELLSSDKDMVPKGRYFRYPNTGWWLVHLVALSIVYTLGHMLWK